MQQHTPKLRHFLFIADPLVHFNLKKDSTFVMMKEMQKRGHTISICETKHLQHKEKTMAMAQTVHINGIEDGSALWFDVVQAPLWQDLCVFDAVIMRTDPPFDAEYIYATHLLDRAEKEGVQVFNKPCAIRNHPEKLSILEFPQFITPTLVTRDPDAIRDFHAQHQDIILKPLDGMGGMGIFRVKADGLNLGSIVETLNQNGKQTVMVQRFIPAIAQGDKRILVIDGIPVSHALARIPQGTEVRGNLAVGGKGVAQPLGVRDREIADVVGSAMAQRGLFLVGLDVIGNCLTEINVTSPTCFQEIKNQTGIDVAALFVDALLKKIQQKVNNGVVKNEGTQK